MADGDNIEPVGQGAVVPSLVIASPYSFSSSHNHGVLIFPILLNGKNYGEWSVKFLNALQAKRKIGFINDVLGKPATTYPNFENWISVNSMIVGWIRASIEPKVKFTVTFFSDACELWKELKQRFSVGNIVRIHQIKEQLSSCKQNGRSVIEYYGKLFSLWEGLQMYRPLPLCTCGAGNTISKEREEEKLHQFVMELDDSRFGNIYTSIIGSDPLPSLAEAYSRVIQEKRRITSVQERDYQHNAAARALCAYWYKK